MDELLDSIGIIRPKLFCTLDFMKGFHQMKMHPDSVCKSAFRCHLGIFEYTRVPFGVTNGPATFQRMVHIVLSGIDPRWVFNYLDDIVMLAKDW